MGWDIQCPMCGAKGNLNQCNACQYWFCGDHLFRHRKCGEGK